MSGLLSAETKFASSNFETAWSEYKPTVLKLSQGRVALEIGAGRAPLFSAQEISQNEIDYVANDISRAELDQIGWESETLCFDACGDIPADALGRFDVIFSKMVLEHVVDAESYYRNALAMLKPGGIILTFHPTLYAFPFLLNLILPESISVAVVKAFFPYRNSDVAPKFPAYYRLCRSTNSNSKKIKDVGFTDVEIIPFYGHNYFNRIPFLAGLTTRFSDFCQTRDLRYLSSYAYTIARK